LIALNVVLFIFIILEIITLNTIYPDRENIHRDCSIILCGLDQTDGYKQ